MEFNMAYGQFLRLMKAGEKPWDAQVKIVQVDVYDNPLLAERFQNELISLSARGRPLEEDWVFHGTGSADNVQRIMLEGFKVGGIDGIPMSNGAKHGNGVYTAKGPDTPMMYGKETGLVILARALRGRRSQRAGTAGYDSDSWEPSGDWVVFQRGQQLLPIYVVHYKAASSVGDAAAARSTRQAGPRSSGWPRSNDPTSRSRSFTRPANLPRADQAAFAVAQYVPSNSAWSGQSANSDRLGHGSWSAEQSARLRLAGSSSSNSSPPAPAPFRYSDMSDSLSDLDNGQRGRSKTTKTSDCSIM